MNALFPSEFPKLHDSEAGSLRPSSLWSLGDMLDKFADQFLVLGKALANAERDLLRYLSGGEGNKVLSFDNPVLVELNRSIDLVAGLNGPIELQSIIRDVRKLSEKIKNRNTLTLIKTADVVSQLGELQKDLRLVLQDRWFYYLRQDLMELYQNPCIFGEKIAKKFKPASQDLEHAGNCLALGESTGCVLHLVRAMEAVLKTVSKKLKVTINPKDTWGMILTNTELRDRDPSRNRRAPKK